MTNALGAVQFRAPFVNPTPTGLYGAVNFTEEDGVASRWLGEGVEFQPTNYGGRNSSGVWDAPWCGDPTDPDARKETLGRPNWTDPFPPITVWAWDECDPSGLSRAEVEANAQQILRLREQYLVEREFAARLLADAAALADGIASVPDVRAAIGYLEDAMAETSTYGVFHARPAIASEEWGLVLPRGQALTSPLGHQWVFGGGYVDTLDDTIVATSLLYGWRGPVRFVPHLEQRYNQYSALAERSVVIGYEAVIAAVTITP